MRGTFMNMYWGVVTSTRRTLVTSVRKKMLLSRLMVGEAAEYNSACVNTLRRPSTVTNSPAAREIWWPL